MTTTALALLLALSLSAPAAAPPQDAGGEAAAEAPDRRRLLTLEDGRVLRVRSRRVDGRWQTRAGRAWRELEGRVVRARVEKDLLAEARRRGGALGRADREGRVELAAWMVAEGLHPEALAELDRVLADAPEHPGALGLIAEASIALDSVDDDARATDPVGALRAVLAAGAAGTPAVREVAIRRLGELGRFVDLRAVLSAELKVGQNRRREFAAHAARRLYRGELLRELASRAMLDPFGGVRAEAARGLRDADDVAVLGPAIQALNSEHANVRAHAAEAMGTVGHAAAVEPLIHHLAALQAGGASNGYRAHVYLGQQTAYVRDYDVEIAQAASIADPIIGVQDAGVVLDARTVVQMTRVVEMRTVIASLRKLTSAEADAPDAWARWWEENGAAWRSRDRASDPRRPRSGLLEALKASEPHH